MAVCVREAHFVLVHCAVENNVGPEGMKHLGKALETNRTVTHVTIGG